MSSTPSTNPRQRVPMFYCHECRAEMRPLMVPDPHCAACNGTFVEELPEDTAPDHPNPDDPRSFQQDFGDGLFNGDDPAAMFGQGGDPVVQLMNLLMMRGMGPLPPGARNGTTIRFDMNGGRGRVLFTSGGGGGPLADIVPGPAGGGRSPGAGMPPHPLEGLFALLSSGRPMGSPGGGGQFGDYVFDQTRLDEIITRLMEQSQGAQPVPAPDDMIAKLPRKKIAAGDPLTEKECAVCKDTFEPTTGADSLVTLPCSPNPKFQHTFHDDCIVPWLKQNGTCPVCRFQLVPQPEPHGPAPATPRSDGPQSPHSPSSGGDGGTNPGGSGFSGFWEMITNAAHRATGSSNNSSSSNNNNNSSSSQQYRARSPRSNGPSSGPSSRSDRNVPGSWDSLD